MRLWSIFVLFISVFENRGSDPIEKPHVNSKYVELQKSNIFDERPPEPCILLLI